MVSSNDIHFFMTGTDGRSADMNDKTSGGQPDSFSANASELQKFARCFTQEQQSQTAGYAGVAYEYIQRLPADRKAVLEREFRAFLYESGADSDEALLQLWYAHGAGEWDPDLTVRPMMSDFYWMMNPDAPELEKLGAEPVVNRGVAIIGLKSRREEEGP